MSAESIRLGIASRIASQWNYAEMPVFPDNQPKPDTAGKPWSRWVIRIAHTEDRDIGATQKRWLGTLGFQIFLPEESGTTAAMKANDHIEALFGRLHLALSDGYIEFSRATLTWVGQESDGLRHWDSALEFYADTTS